MGEFSVVEHQPAIGVPGDLLVVGHQDEGDVAGGVEITEDIDDLLAGARVEIAGRLVGHQNGRPVGQRPGNGHPLLLAAGKLTGMMVHAIGQPDSIEQFRGASVPLAAGHAARIEHR